MQLDHINAAIHAEQARFINGDLANLAVSVLHQILSDPKANGKLRLDAAKTVLDRAGHVAPKAIEQAQEGRKSLAEMSFEELGAYVAEAKARVLAIEHATPIAPDMHANGMEVIEVIDEGTASGTQGRPADEPAAALEPDARPTPGGGAERDGPLVVTPDL